MDPVAARSLKRTPDGKIRGLAADGTPIKGVIRGKSVARQLMEEEAERKRREKSKKRRKRR